VGEEVTGGADITLRAFIVSRRIVYFRGEVVHKGRLFPLWGVSGLQG